MGNKSKRIQPNPTESDRGNRAGQTPSNPIPIPRVRRSVRLSPPSEWLNTDLSGPIKPNPTFEWKIKLAATIPTVSQLHFPNPIRLHPTCAEYAGRSG